MLLKLFQLTNAQSLKEVDTTVAYETSGLVLTKK